MTADRKWIIKFSFESKKEPDAYEMERKCEQFAEFIEEQFGTDDVSREIVHE